MFSRWRFLKGSVLCLGVMDCCCNGLSGFVEIVLSGNHVPAGV